MPTRMADHELETNLKSAEEVDSYEYQAPDDEDDYFTARLYKARDQRHFRVIESSGMNSQFNGAGDTGEWLSDKEAGNWKEF